MAATLGVSPLARGSPPGGHTPPSRHRCIPTCAGQPIQSPRPPGSAGVYPHLRGAAIDRRRPPAKTAGVSPLARGSPAPHNQTVTMARCIPTCAGQPSKSAFTIEHEKVYPHLRGAACFALSGTGRASGVSPLARGSHMSAYK